MFRLFVASVAFALFQVMLPASANTDAESFSDDFDYETLMEMSDLDLDVSGILPSGGGLLHRFDNKTFLRFSSGETSTDTDVSASSPHLEGVESADSIPDEIRRRSTDVQQNVVNLGLSPRFLKLPSTAWSKASSGLLWRVNKDGDIECAAIADRSRCIWWGEIADLRSDDSQPTIVCGEDYASKFASDGYSKAGHWCATLREQEFDRNPRMLKTRWHKDLTLNKIWRVNEDGVIECAAKANLKRCVRAVEYSKDAMENIFGKSDGSQPAIACNEKQYSKSGRWCATLRESELARSPPVSEAYVFGQDGDQEYLNGHYALDGYFGHNLSFEVTFTFTPGESKDFTFLLGTRPENIHVGVGSAPEVGTLASLGIDQEDQVGDIVSVTLEIGEVSSLEISMNDEVKETIALSRELLDAHMRRVIRDGVTTLMVSLPIDITMLYTIVGVKIGDEDGDYIKSASMSVASSSTTTSEGFYDYRVNYGFTQSHRSGNDLYLHNVRLASLGEIYVAQDDLSSGEEPGEDDYSKVALYFLAEQLDDDEKTSHWKATYTRGGTLPSVCPSGTEYDAGLCYPPADNPEYSCVGPVCWQNCVVLHCSVSQRPVFSAWSDSIAPSGFVVLSKCAPSSASRDSPRRVAWLYSRPRVEARAPRPYSVKAALTTNNARAQATNISSSTIPGCFRTCFPVRKL